jgi:biopolymer transport protein ExbD
MAFSSNSSGGGPMADINVTPLVDVMLVLLIIFMITAPLMTHKVKVVLPKASLSIKTEVKTPPVTLTVKNDGSLYWNDEPATTAQLEQKLAVTVQLTPQPEVDVRADKDTKYGVINAAVQMVRHSGMRKVAFISGQERNK